ncbi:MAG: alpha/beta hydrolase [Chitinophagales bacterium]|nr:alpha/beta hydrolase [Chitinophagales bacterium]MDW8393147.1 alpha/beta hydrolase [Chitinophagales bacterium]
MIYFFPGLATDGRLLEGYRFAEPVTVVSYPRPQPRETLESYARRLAVEHPFEPNSILMGFSLGGMLAALVGRHIPTRQVIVISSLLEQNRPWWMTLPLWIPLHRWLPDSALRRLFLLLGDLFARKTPEQRRLLQDMVAAADLVFVRWAIDAVARWSGLPDTSGMIRIHGSGDRLFPLRYVNADRIIKDGQHFLIVQNRKELNRHLNELITVPLPADTGR